MLSLGHTDIVRYTFILAVASVIANFFPALIMEKVDIHLFAMQLKDASFMISLTVAFDIDCGQLEADRRRCLLGRQGRYLHAQRREAWS